MKVWKLFFIYTRGKGKNPFFHFSDFPVFPKILKKEYNIRFKIYPSPFTSSPHHSFHIFVIGFPTFVFWVYPSKIFRYLSEIISYSSEIFRYLSELFSYSSEIFFWMIPWYFSHFISRIHANRTNRIGRKRKRRIFAFENKANDKCKNWWNGGGKNWWIYKFIVKGV